MHKTQKRVGKSPNRVRTKRKARLPRRVFKSRILDFSLGFFGLCLAAASAYFPWYVYSNFDSFGPPKMAFTGREDFEFDLPTLPVQTVDIRKPLFSADVDTLVTGSIPTGADDDEATEPLSPAARVDRKRFLKSSSEFKLVFATRGHALIQDDGELIFVSPGGTLPDGSKVRSISKAGGHWELMTSQSRTLRWQK